MSRRGMYWGFSVVDLVVVGLNGSSTTFNKENLGYIESLGQAVLPESLLKYPNGLPN